MGLLRLKDTKLPQTKRDEVFCINSNIKTPQTSANGQGRSPLYQFKHQNPSE